MSTPRRVFLPTRRLAAFAFAAAAVSLVAAYVESVRPALYALDATLALAAIADALFLWRGRLLLERHAAAIFSVGRANAVTLQVTNRGGRFVRGVVADDPIEDARSDGLPATFALAPGETATVRYEVTPHRRGARAFGAVTARYFSSLGLVARQERHAVANEVDVYPDVHAARALELLRRQGREDARLGSLRVRGGDTEFERLRPYQRGDEVRHVDWRASARKDDSTVRQFQAESNQNVVFALDIGRGMRGETDGIRSVDHALNAALLAADVALRGGDKAGLMTFDELPRAFLAPSAGRAAARKLARAVYDVEASMASTDYRAAMAFLQTQVRARSLLIVFTQLLEPRSARDLASALRHLMPRHLPLCVLFKDPEVEALVAKQASEPADVYVRAAAAESLSWRDSILRSLKRSGVLVVDARPEDVTPDLVKTYLEVKARRLL